MAAWREFDAVGLAYVVVTRDLRMGSEPLRWHLKRLMQRPMPPAESEESVPTRRLRSTWAEAIASIDETNPHAFALQSISSQRLVVQTQLSRRVGANARWAVEAGRRGRTELSALYWGQALIDASLVDWASSSAGSEVDRVVTLLGTRLRGQAVRDAAIEMIGRIDRELGKSPARVDLLFLGATMLYAEGRMSDCLLVLDRVEALNPDWDDSEKLAAGLVRAVALIKLKHFNQAESALSKLADYHGEDETMAQVVFLRGWIHLHQGETLLALERFRHLVDVYPDTSYAAKTRTLIDRLDPPSAENLQP